MDQDTIRIYDARADDYARITETDTPGRLLAQFINALPQGGQVLDLGCGPGSCARLMARAGLAVSAWDASAEMAERAGNHPGVNARQAQFKDLTTKAEYDGIWANFSLLHAPRADMPGHLAAIHRALRPDGQVQIALKTGSGEKRDKIGRFYTYYTEDELTGLMRTAGFTISKIATGRDKGLDGALADWVSVAAHA